MTLSGLTSAAIAEVLAEIREIAKLSGAEALEKTDVLIWSLIERHAGIPEADDAALRQEEEARLRREMLRVRHAIERQGVRPAWDAEGLRVEARLVAEFNPELAAEAVTLADQAEVAVHAAALEQARDKPILAASSTAGILAQISRAEAALGQRGALDDVWRGVARAGRERCARYRAEKRLRDAEVADVTNAAKAAAMRAEAAVLLRQDWESVFPGEVPPDA